MTITEGEVAFENADWVTGLSRQVIGICKENGGNYVKERKVWIVGPKLESMLRSKFIQTTPVKIEDDLEETFGTNSSGEVTVKGLLGLFKELKSMEGLLEHLSQRKCKEGILEKVDVEYNMKLEAFNKIVY